MTLKQCTGCNKIHTTKTAKYIGRMFNLLLFNCDVCNSTFTGKKKNEIQKHWKISNSR